MKLSEVVAFLKETHKLFKELKKIKGAATGEARARRVAEAVKKAGRLVEAMEGEFEVTTEDRLELLELQIDLLEEEAEELKGPMKRGVEIRIADLKVLEGLLLASKAFEGIVVFNPTDRARINKLLIDARIDVAKRKRVASAVSAVIRVLRLGLKIATRAASFHL